MNYIKILYEDKYIAVIEKPSGLLTVPYPGSHEKTALDLLCAIRQKRGLVHGSFRPAVVHRLDKETSGVMMFALTAEAQRKIMDTWQTMVTGRIYRALAENPVSAAGLSRQSAAPKTPAARKMSAVQKIPAVPKMSAADSPAYADSGIIDAPLALNVRHHSYVPASPEREKNVKSAVTHFRVLERGSRYTLFELELDTGRTNQIRAHLASTGYTLAGDKAYRAETDPDRRLCLHAKTLSFVHPYTGELMSFEVPEPDSWIRILRSRPGAKRPERRSAAGESGNRQSGGRNAPGVRGVSGAPGGHFRSADNRTATGDTGAFNASGARSAAGTRNASGAERFSRNSGNSVPGGRTGRRKRRT